MPRQCSGSGFDDQATAGSRGHDASPSGRSACAWLSYLSGTLNMAKRGIVIQDKHIRTLIRSLSRSFYKAFVHTEASSSVLQSGERGERAHYQSPYYFTALTTLLLLLLLIIIHTSKRTSHVSLPLLLDNAVSLVRQ